MKKKLSLLLFVICTVLCACEYDNTDVNYIELDPPSPNHDFMFNIASVPQGEPIYIYAPTYLYYELENLPAGADYEIKWYLDGEFYYGYSNDGDRNYIHIDTRTVSRGDHALKLEIIAGTGTGSLAEVLGMEKYAGTHTFTLRVGTTDRKLNIRQEISEDKHLKIVWDKPDLQQVEVEKYVLDYTDMETNTYKQVEITDADATEWIDPFYVYGGYQRITITTFFRDGKLNNWHEDFMVKSPSFGSDNFITEDAGWGKVRLWMKPYPYDAVFEITIGDNFKQRMTVDDFPIVVDRPFFPDVFYINVGFIATGGSRVQYRETVSIPYPSVFLQFPRGMYPSAFDKIIYLDGDKRILAMNAENLTIISDISYDNSIHINYIYADPASGRKIMVVNNHTMRIYRDASLTSPKEVTLDLSWITDMAYVPENMLYVFGQTHDYITYDYSLWLLDADSGEVLHSVKLPAYTSRNTRAQFSVDGRYMMVYNPYGMDAARFMDIYELNGIQMTLIKSFTAEQAETAVSGSCMHPTDPTLFMFNPSDGMNGRITLMRMPSFTEVASIDGIFMETDPCTGNILYRKLESPNWRHAITSPMLDRSLFEFADWNIRGAPIFNNTFFSVLDGYHVSYFNLSPFLAR